MQTGFRRNRSTDHSPGRPLQTSRALGIIRSTVPVDRSEFTELSGWRWSTDSQPPVDRSSNSALICYKFPLFSLSLSLHSADEPELFSLQNFSLSLQSLNRSQINLKPTCNSFFYFQIFNFRIFHPLDSEKFGFH